MAVNLSKILINMFGSRNERLVKRYHRYVQQINAVEEKVLAMTDPGMRERAAEMREGLRSGKFSSSDLLPEAFAIMRESMDRHIGIRSIFDPENHFDPDRFDDQMLEAYDQVQQQMIVSGQPWQLVSIPPEIYSAVRKLYPESRPPFRARCFDVQLIGGMVLYEGRIAEMATGEGKTFVAPLACFMRVLEGFHCHVVTVNDYLVRRDANWVRPAFENLGMSVGFIQSDMEAGGAERRKQYESDVTYGTNSEFGFDYLRDNMKVRVSEQVQGALDFAIVDEVDSILIDEARTPLIISGAAHDDAPKYRAADLVARKVIDLNRGYANIEKAIDAARRAIKVTQADEEKAKGDKRLLEAAAQKRANAERMLEEAEKAKESVTQYIEVELDRKTARLTHEGIASAQEAAGVGSFYVGNNMEWPHLMEQALRAHICFERDKDYVVEKQTDPRFSEVCIVDEFTGRKMQGRQWSDGLHQAVEAKERVNIKEETQTLATITLQNFFKLYRALSGMTGTAQTEAEEFDKIYRLDVVSIPTNRPAVRADSDDRVYRTEKEKWEAIVDEVREESDKGRPVLVGTTTVEKSEMLSNMLKRKYGIEHEVLNAKQHEREAHIILKAGQQHMNVHGETVGNVTIATNMAGRGTDIKLSADTTKAGGLHVIGTERHTARRIDNQLRGRSGRQGDPGSSRFYVSLQDELMAMFAGEWTIKVLGWLGMEEGMAIEDKRISGGILRAQKKVEERNFLARKNLLEYDDVMDRQRTTFYGMRQRVLEGRQVDEIIWDMIGDAIKDAVDRYITKDYVAATVSEWARTNFNVEIDAYDLRGMRDYSDLVDYIRARARAEVDTNITSTLVEFTGEDETDSGNWDARNLSSWAMSRFQVQLSQSQIRRMTLEELEGRLRAAAVEQIENRAMTGLDRLLDRLFAETALANWAIDKFGIEIKPEEMMADVKTRTILSSEDIVKLIENRARAAYRQREIEYPVDHVLTFAFANQESHTDNPYAADYLRAWVKNKYHQEISFEEIRGKTLDTIRQRMLQMQADHSKPENMAREVDDLIKAHPDETELRQAFKDRYGVTLRVDEWSSGSTAGAARLPERVFGLDGRPLHYTPARQPADDEDTGGRKVALDMRAALIARVHEVYRAELTELEQFVLIQIFDESWKDHLYAMDLLKNGVGLMGFAERDPRIVYKKQGFEYFEQMMAGVRDKVTDLIFRARVTTQVAPRSNYRETAAVHEDAGGYGVAENVSRTAAAVEPLQPISQSAGEGGEVPEAKVKTIVREAPKVGRNDPCPCGSGKKYKKCCGAEAA